MRGTDRAEALSVCWALSRLGGFGPGGGRFVVELAGDVVVGGDGGGDAVADGARYLASGVLADVAGGEEPGLRRRHPVVHDDVAGRVSRDEVADEVRVRVVADEDEYRVDSHLAGLAGDDVAQLQR